MKPALTLTALVALPLIASAALPPQYQRQRELVSIIQSGDVSEAMDGRPIDAIETDGSDTYIVRAGECTVIVEIVGTGERMPEGWVGPRQYDLQVGEAECIDDISPNEK
ncbi:hypothetical protein D1224_04970 [Henriciella barbarensis]|uniref:Uncharacterized protein n=1 Tax=Henriciella barbarensis TaxID=86342 RepID=A0A399QXG4_9PROT|nr:hypothetical protein [Henriciella barbarensis]RIJ23618.1 hypothetical protein D1224_04970 [Henriciella barbarensis]